MTPHELNHFFFDELEVCGCGMPAAAAVLVRDILRCAPFYEEENAKKLEALLPTNGLFYLTLYALDRVGLIEHGGGIGGSWLTDKGEEVLAALDEISKTDPELESIFPDCGEGIPDDCPKCNPK